jgi:hypothetical protein
MASVLSQLTSLFLHLVSVQNKVNTAGGNCYTSKGWLLAGIWEPGLGDNLTIPGTECLLVSEE